MIRPFGKLVLALGALALAASPAWAQQGKGRGGFGFGFGPGGGAGFLMAPNVQKDLKLSEEQTGKIQETLREVREKHADEVAGLRELPPEERQQKVASLGKEVNDEIKKGLSFSPEQSKRFDQISIQARGLTAFADPSIVGKLKLTDDQKAQVREIFMASRSAAAGFNKDASAEERAEAFRKMRETQQENVKKVQALLTEDQKKEWKELTGEPIEIEFRPRRPNN